jgi:hypothetical protein
MGFKDTLSKIKQGSNKVDNALLNVPSNLLKKAGEGFLTGALGGTVGGGIVSGLRASSTGAAPSGKQTGTTGDDTKDIVNAIRDLQSDTNSNSAELKSINDNISGMRETLGNGFTVLYRSGMETNKLLSQILSKTDGGGSIIDIPDINRTRSGGASKPGGASRVGTVLRGAGGRLPVVGGVIAGGLEYAETGNIGRSIASGAGTAIGGVLGAVGGSLAGPVGTVVGGVGGGLAGEKAGTALYDRFFGGGAKTEKMAELETKEAEQKAKAASPAEKDSITYNAKEIIFKSDKLTFEYTKKEENTSGSSGSSFTSSAPGPAAPGPAAPGPAAPGPAGPSGSTGGGGAPTGDAQIDQILATIRKRESSNDYNAKSKSSSASGAYQFIDSTWRARAKAAGVDISAYPTARSAPPEIQDKVAAHYAKDILKRSGGNISAIPNEWYTGNMQGNMTQKQLAANRGLTSQTYTAGWLKDFNKMSSESGSQTAPAASASPFSPLGSGPDIGRPTGGDSTVKSSAVSRPAEAPEPAEKSGGLPSGDIVALGKALQGMGVRVSEHPAFGSVGRHARNSAHYSGNAIDVNAGYGIVEADHPQWGPKFDQLAKMAQAAGYKVIWRSAGHKDHLHIQTGGSGGSGDSPAGGGMSTAADRPAAGARETSGAAPVRGGGGGGRGMLGGPVSSAPTGPSQSEVAKLWEKYNETGNPADFARADEAMKAMRSGSGGSPVAAARKNAAPKSIPMPPKRPLGLGEPTTVDYGPSDESLRAQDKTDAIAKENLERLSDPSLAYIDAEKTINDAAAVEAPAALNLGELGRAALTAKDKEINEKVASGISPAAAGARFSSRGIAKAIGGGPEATREKQAAQAANARLAGEGAPGFEGAIGNMFDNDLSMSTVRSAPDYSSSSSLGFGDGGADLNRITDGAELTARSEQTQLNNMRSSFDTGGGAVTQPSAQSSQDNSVSTNEVPEVIPHNLIRGLFGPELGFLGAP